jgi:hypothetical protein
MRVSTTRWVDSSKLVDGAEVYINTGFDTYKVGVAYVAGPVSEDGTLPVTFEGSNRISWVPLRAVSAS